MARSFPLSTVSLSRQTSSVSQADEFEIDPLPDPPVADIDRYEMGNLIGRGGMGLVYQAYDKIFDCEVALKVLLQKRQDPEAASERFYQEARTTARLQHPGIVPVYDMGVSKDGQPYFTMKLVLGRTLGQLLQSESGTALQRSRLFEVFSRVCQTIAYAHSRQTVHLDLKPSNVMVGAYGEVHVMDWGLSRRLDSNSNPQMSDSPSLCDSIPDDMLSTILTNSKVIGTPSYMAPEQARGHQIGIHSDVFGLGAILCEILTGAPPYEGDTFRRVYRRAARGALRRTYRRLEACDAAPALISLTKRCLTRNAADRMVDAATVAEEIATFIESSMQRAEQDLCRFFEISKDLFCIASLDGYFKRVNSNFSNVLGYSDHDLVSKPFIQFIHPEDVPETLEAVKTLAAGKAVAEFRNRYRDINDRFRWFEWTAKSIPEDNIIFAVARVIDPPFEGPAI